MNTADPTPTRRQVLRTGGLGLAAAAFLAACSKDIDQAGQSGDTVPTTAAPPTVPTLEPTAAALDLDQTVLRTGSSLELLAAEVYETYGPELDSPEWQATAERFAADHTAAAAVFREATNAEKRVDVPNAVVRASFVTPMDGVLTFDTTQDPKILDFFRDLESTLAATYVTAAGTFTEADWRAQVTAFASAAARRVAVLGDGGEGEAPVNAMYPLDDLISQTAYLLNTPVATSTPEE